MDRPNNIDELAAHYSNVLRRNVDIGKLKKGQADPISDLIHYNDLNAVKQRISNWVSARLIARYHLTPDWTDLIRVYDYVFIDSHVIGIINGIKQKIKGKEFSILDQKGEIDEELTKHLRTKWFSKYIGYFIESFFYPYSLVELGEYKEGKFKDIDLIKREYVVPQYKAVKMFLYGTAVPVHLSPYPGLGKQKPKDTKVGLNYTLDYFESPERVNDYIYMPCPLHDLGLLDMAAPHAIGKMGSYTLYLDYLQKFVIPFRWGQTNINDPLRKNNMDSMMSAWGGSGYAVTDLEDTISLLEQGGSNTAPFTDLFTYSNNEISKAFASAVGIFDEKNFVGSAEAGERMLDALISAYCSEFEYNANDELLPRLALRDKRFLGKTFEYVDKEVVPYAQRVDAVVKLASVFKLKAEEVSEKTGFDLEEKEVPEQLQAPKIEEKEEIKPTKGMVENAERALKYVAIKELDIDRKVILIADKIKEDQPLQPEDLLNIRDIPIDTGGKPYVKSINSVIFDLLGGKEGKELAKKYI